MTLEGDTLLQIKKLCYDIFPPSVNLCWQKIAFLSQHIIVNYLPLSYHFTPILSQPQQNRTHQSFLRVLWFHIAKYDTIIFSKAPKSYVKLITYINNDNGFDLIVAVLFDISRQIGVIRPKYQDIVIYFRLF